MAAGGAVGAALSLTTGQTGEGRLDGPIVALCGFSGYGGFRGNGTSAAGLPVPGSHQSRSTSLDRDRRHAAPHPATRNTPPQPRTSSISSFEGVTFSYGRTVLDNVQLHLPQGRTAVLLGPSGSGKSTLAHLSLRLIDPDAGRITLGGIDLRNLRQEDLHSRIAYVSQNTDLFAADIRDNFPSPAPTPPMMSYWKRWKSLTSPTSSRPLPNGILTWVGENGVLLSGGQARRLAARPRSPEYRSDDDPR